MAGGLAFAIGLGCMAKDDDQDPRLQDLEAREEKEKRDARELLAGFDRPGRGPKPPQSGDFVAHFSGKNERPVAKPKPKRDRSREEATFVLPKKKRIALLLPWFGAAALMLLLGFLVAFVATRDPDNRASQVPSATTTITSVMRTREDIPPPDPALPPAQATETTIAIPVPTLAPSASSSKAHARSDDTYLRDF